MIKNPEIHSKQEMARRKNMGPIFGKAVFLGIWFDEDDIRYIKTKMMTDKKYRAISGKIGGTNVNREQLHKFQDIWLLKFLDDPEITTGVKAFIIYYTGCYRGDLKLCDEYGDTHRYTDFIHERFIAERWMETCMHKRTGHKKHPKYTKHTKKQAVKELISPSKKLLGCGAVTCALKVQKFRTELKAKGVTRCR